MRSPARGGKKYPEHVRCIEENYLCSFVTEIGNAGDLQQRNMLSVHMKLFAYHVIVQYVNLAIAHAREAFLRYFQLGNFFVEILPKF